MNDEESVVDRKNVFPFLKNWANPFLLFFKYGPNPASFCLYSSFSQYNDKYSAIFDGVLGTRTRDHMMVGKDKYTEPQTSFLFIFNQQWLQKTVDFFGNRTHIVGIEGKHADHHHHALKIFFLLLASFLHGTY